MEKILVIDDDDLVRKSLRKLLTVNGFDVVSAESYDEAMKAIAGQDLDLVLSDIKMPGKNGVETVSEIRKRLGNAGKAELPIIFITGYAEDGEKLNATFHGEILRKPVDNDFLLATIREYL